MSLHIDLNPEAATRLHRQQRNSTISSIAIAVLSVVLLALTLGYFILPAMEKDKGDFAVIREIVSEPEPPQGPKVPVNIDRKPSAPSRSMARVIASTSLSRVSIPVPDTEVTTPSLDFGNGNDFGRGWSKGEGDDGRKLIPHDPRTSKRCSKPDRLARLAETGGTPECEDAVVRALDWLKANQSANGAWGGENQAAMTGLALLAFLGHCETPRSERYGESVSNAITWLVDLGLRNEGKLATNTAAKHWPYEHAIATYALAEAAAFCKQVSFEIPGLVDVTQQAGRFIVENQHPKSGGWDYSYDTYGPRGGDLSITAWHIQALKACKHAPVDIPGIDKAAGKAVQYVGSLQCKDGGFAYASANEAPHAAGYRTMTGAAVLCLQLWDKGSQSGVRRGAKYIEENTRFDYHSEFSDLYGHYYEAQAMMNRGGKQWEKYNSMFRDTLLKSHNADGSWPAPGGGRPIRAVAPQYTANAVYRTCLNTLMLEVYYRFLPGTGAK